jgi:UPF0755 protein
MTGLGCVMRRARLAAVWVLLVACRGVGSGTAEITVDKGATATSLAGALAAEGLVPSEMAWKVFLRTTKADCVQAGRQEVPRGASMQDVLDALCSKPDPKTISITVIEGWTIRDIDASLAKQRLSAPGAFLAIAKPDTVAAPFPITGPSLEGYLLPDTYAVDPEGFTPLGFARTLVGAFDARFVQGASLGSRSLHEIVVMASLLEREEPSSDNRPLVAGILWKRLDEGWALGVDATSRYGLPDWNDRKAFLARLRNADDPFNTRLRKGLPPHAIGSPSLDALRAATAPKSSPYYYYLHDRQGGLHPAKDAAGHEANRREFDVY